MIKDLKNVAITFSLIALMLYGGSFLYTKKVLADEEAERIETERQEKELEAQMAMQQELLLKWQEQERILALEAIEAPKEEVIDTPVPVVPTEPAKTNTQFADAVAKEQALLLAQQKADALAQQKADQLASQLASEALAQQMAEQKAAALKVAAKKKASRASRAS